MTRPNPQMYGEEVGYAKRKRDSCPLVEKSALRFLLRTEELRTILGQLMEGVARLVSAYATSDRRSRSDGTSRLRFRGGRTVDQKIRTQNLKPGHYN